MSEYLLEYPDASQECLGAMVPGRLKLTASAITFKHQKTGKVDTIQASDIELLSWQRLAGSWGVRCFTKNGSLFRFGGFADDDQDKLSKFFKDNYGTELGTREYSVKGWNWGTARFKGKVLTFEVGGQPDFDIPLVNVSHVVSGKQEVTMEFHKNDDASVGLCEMRFHIPPGEGDDDPVESFKDEVMKQASVITATGNSIAEFAEVNCLTPRGRYEIKLYQTFIQLHGKTFDYKIPMTNVLRLFLLPHKDTRLTFFVISLDPPIKQGMTRYPFLIFQFNQEDEVELDLPFSEEELQEKFEGRLEKNMSGHTYEVVSKMFRALTQRKITTPGKFVGHSGSPAVSCSYKAQAGYLYPLERGFLYVHKPPVHIRLEEVSNVNFARSGGAATRSFDLEIETKGGQMHTFSSIEKEEYPKLFEYINSKKLRIKNRGGKGDGGGIAADFGDSDEEESHDPYLHYAKAEGDEKESDEESEDSESEDEDFVPGKEESDVADEFDSNISSSSSEAGSEGRGSDGEKQKRKEKKEKKKKKAKERESKRERSSSDKPMKKKKPDDGRPKRPLSAYFLWLNENRESIKKEGMSVSDVAKKGGELWRNLSADKKKKYEELAGVEKKKYEDAVKEWKKAGGGKKARASAGSSGGDGTSSSKKKSISVQNISPSKIRSKEFISSSEDSDSGGGAKSSPAPSGKKGSGEGSSKETPKKMKKGSSEDEEEEEEDEESAGSTPATSEDDD